MHAHEKRIVREVLQGERTAHLLYQGTRLKQLVNAIVQQSAERVVVVGAPDAYLEKIQRKIPGVDTAGGIDAATSEAAGELGAVLAPDTTVLAPAPAAPLQRRQRAKPGLGRLRVITAKTGLGARSRMYTEKGCVFVPERLFLTDLLKERVGGADLKVVYLLGDWALPSQQSVRDFVWLAWPGKLSVLMVYSEGYSFSEEVQSAGVPSSGIFLYPAFRKCVAQAMKQFSINEVQLKIDQFRELIQTNLLSIAGKVEKLAVKGLFDGYVRNRHRSLLFSTTLLFNADINVFLSYFQEITSSAKNLDVLESMYGAVENEYKRDAKYGNCLSWLLLDLVEETIALGKEVALTEKTYPKRKALEVLVEKRAGCTLAIVSCSLPEEMFEPVGPGLPVIGSHQVESAIRRLAKQPRPHLILLNYTVALLRKVKMARQQWKARGVAIGVTVITVANSTDELFNLELLKKEKDMFLSAIGMKKNRPEFIERKPFVLSPSAPNTPVLAMDFRELRSSLPFSLAKRFTGQFKLEVDALPQGDYVLNQTYFVERKSLPDLIESFKTGRLFKQMESLIHSHEHAYLLVEFPEEEKLSLEAYTASRLLDLDLIYGVVTLLQTVPRVKMYLSNSTTMSAALIQMLAKKPSAPSSATGTSMSPQLTECLLSIPHVTHENVNQILEKFNSIYDLGTSDQARLSALLPPELATRIFEFFNHPISPPAKELGQGEGAEDGQGVTG